MVSTKICGIVGSPKKNGNVDLLVSQVLDGASTQGVDTCKIYLNDLNVGPCQSCGVDPHPEYCLFDDDMKIIYEKLQSCDAVVLGSPVYFDTVSAPVKLMIDRCNCLMPYVKRSDGTYHFERRMKKRKKGILIAVAGTGQEFDTIQTTVKGFFQWTNVELVETILHVHDDNELGSVKNDKRRMDEAFQVGVRLVQSLKTRSSTQK